MPVVLRYRKLKDGSESAFLDIHHNGVRIQRFLKIILRKPKTYLEKEEYKDKKLLAEKLRIEQEKELLSSEHGIDLSLEKKKNISFTEFYIDYINNTLLADKRTYVAALNKFKAYAGKEVIYPFEITETFLEKYKKYLNNHLSRETPYNYFKKLCRVLKEATKARLFKTNPSANIVNKRGKSDQKDILTLPEIKALYQAHCSNYNVKRAFLFTCLSGLRHCDILNLRWKNIDNGMISLIQQKTKAPVRIPLTSEMQNLLGTPGLRDENVFNLPSHNGCNKALKNWTKNAEIEKHITWHCGRHSFGTILIENDINLAVASTLLGHTSLKKTMRYVRMKDDLRHDALNKFSNALKTTK